MHTQDYQHPVSTREVVVFTSPLTLASISWDRLVSLMIKKISTQGTELSIKMIINKSSHKNSLYLDYVKFSHQLGILVKEAARHSLEHEVYLLFEFIDEELHCSLVFTQDILPSLTYAWTSLQDTISQHQGDTQCLTPHKLLITIPVIR